MINYDNTDLIKIYVFLYMEYYSFISQFALWIFIYISLLYWERPAGTCRHLPDGPGTDVTQPQ